MLLARPSGSRGLTETSWLTSYHTFSFGYYQDPKWNGFGALKVINDDIIKGGGGFQPHGHRDMEIITIILSGALEHKDSLGNGSVITAGEVQRMRAGTGIKHSKFNASEIVPVHLLQVWIEPSQTGLTPDYEQARFDSDAPLTLLVSPDGHNGSLPIAQNAHVWRAQLSASQPVSLDIPPGQAAWLHVTAGRVGVGDAWLNPGDSAGIQNLNTLHLRAEEDATAYVFCIPHA